MTQAQRDIHRKLAVLRHAEATGNVSRTCRYFGISRETFYQWRRAYRARGEQGLINRKPGARVVSRIFRTFSEEHPRS